MFIINNNKRRTVHVFKFKKSGILMLSLLEGQAGRVLKQSDAL